MRGRAALALSLAALAACVLAVGFSTASFTDTSQNPQTISADPDFVAPTATASVIAKSQGGTGGYVRAGGTYYVYANVSESGNPASGIASVKANVSTLTSGQTAVSLSSGAFAVDGVSYNYRSAQLTAGSGLSAGSKTYSLALADADGNSRSQSFAATVENGPFGGSGFDTANGVGDSGKPEQGDTVTFTYGKAPEPASVLAGWTGVAAASVSVVITQAASNDVLSVSGTGLGSVALKGDYVSKTVTFSGSSMTLSGNSIVVTLGSSSSSSSAADENGNKAPVWSPSASAYDRAGYASSTATVTAANDRQF